MRHQQLSKELFKDVKHIAVDCGSREVTIAISYDPVDKSGTTFTTSKKEFMNIGKYLQKDTLMLIEDAHTRPRTEITPDVDLDQLNSSMAHPLTEEQWADIKKDCDELGIMIISSPQKLAPKIRHYAGFTETKEKSDENDAMSLWHYADTKLNRLGEPIWWGWKKFTNNWEITKRRADGYAYKDKINSSCNIERAYGYFKYGNLINAGLVDEKLTPASEFVWKNLDFIYDNLSEEARLITKMSKKKAGKVVKNLYLQNNCKFGNRDQWNLGDLRFHLLVSAACCLIDIHGEVRKRKITNDEGEVVREWIAGWNFIREFIFAPSPYHMNGGVGRSNECNYSKKTFIKDMCAEEGFTRIKNKGFKKAHIEEDPEMYECYRKWEKVHNSVTREIYHLLAYIIDPTIDNRTYKSEEMEVKESHQLELAFA